MSSYNIHTDHLNTPGVITDSVTAVVRWRWDGDPFGSGTPNDDPSSLGAFEFGLRFPGQLAMAETGLYYNYFRDYDPSTGKYVQSDPIGLEGGMNTYAYVDGSPVDATDPTGEFGIIGAGIGAGLDLAVQLAKNGWRLECVDWADVAIAGAVGFVSPGWAKVGKNAFTGFNRARQIQSRLSRARRARYVRRLENKQNEVFRNIAGEVATQIGYQGVKAGAQAVIDDPCAEKCEKP